MEFRREKLYSGGGVDIFAHRKDDVEQIEVSFKNDNVRSQYPYVSLIAEYPTFSYGSSPRSLRISGHQLANGEEMIMGASTDTVDSQWISKDIRKRSVKYESEAVKALVEMGKDKPELFKTLELGPKAAEKYEAALDFLSESFRSGHLVFDHDELKERFSSSLSR